mgnify:FL=1
MKTMNWFLAGACTFLLFTACSNPPPAETDPAPKAKKAAIRVENTSKEDSLAAAERARLEAERLAAEKLEADRARLEEMINQLMSDDVYFEFDRFELTEKARELLAQVGDMLKAEERFIVTVEGHTDARGTEDYNMTLGGKRAMKVKEFLVAYGISSDRMETVSYGKEKPKVEGASEDAYSQNRRANFRVKIK